jgi:hypothetical protein
MIHILPSLVIYFVATPPIKLKLGQQISGGLLIANHLDQSSWWAAPKHWAAASQIIFITLFCVQVHRLAVALVPATTAKLRDYVEPKNYSRELNRHVLTFLHPILLCRMTYWALLEMLLSTKYLVTQKGGQSLSLPILNWSVLGGGGGGGGFMCNFFQICSIWQNMKEISVLCKGGHGL